MAVTYPFAMPATPGFQSIKFTPMTVVGSAMSPYTGQSQQYIWPGQMWQADVVLPPMRDPAVGNWIAWQLALNGQQGTFMLGDSVRKLPVGTIAGTVTVGTGASALTTTLPLSGGTGSFAVGDWLQIGVSLYRVVQLNSGSVDVWPRLRSSYSSGTAITYVNAKGLFRLASNTVSWSADTSKVIGIGFSAMESL